MVKLASVNTFNLYDRADEHDRHVQVEALVASLEADIVAVQELVARDPNKATGAGDALRRLAKAVGMQCELGGEALVAVGGGIHHVGLLWRPQVAVPVVGKTGRFTRESAGMWHSLVTQVFRIGHAQLRVGSVQLSPFDQSWALQDAHQVLRAFHGDVIPGLLGGDFNGIGAQFVEQNDGWAHYDPDPYALATVPWHPDHVYQLDDHGQVDRRVAHRLEDRRLGRMRDAALITGSPWRPTTGHHPHDHHPPRRLDRWYTSWHLPDEAVTGYAVTAASKVGEATDHLPVAVTVDVS